MWSKYRAALFDLDGVITATARLHAAAWKETLDGYLATVDPCLPRLTIETDYRVHIDGRPRYDGTAAFLESRGLALPWGSPDDPPGFSTVCALGNLKDQAFNERLAVHGADVYPDAVLLLDHLGALDLALAVVTASANADAILAAAGLTGRFAVQIDGVVVKERGLRGKPAPDPFLEASTRLGIEPGDAVVIEDAVSGLQAAKAGGFGLVVAVNRHFSPAKLEQAGADVVTDDLTTLIRAAQ